ncbi:phosphoenolpyruvate--protein phosphotransferase [Desulfovermiculus halophilus]|uniref:phosphoenolpyruvate--protein phosphotransferase n=1 Tax=Desulfovermiculus halophilus TaxID=339722 RepID=UPI0004865405|nr:phosphoenolpyruvate--protein phosphotransferase [Desulfovermiculus halophilus]
MYQQPDHLSVITDLSRIIADSSDPEATLHQIAQLIASTYGLDVCSIYVLTPDRQHLVLKATVGLHPESVGSVAMTAHEGLTGLTLEQGRPMLIFNPAQHPRFKLFEQTGEEVFKTFLGIPLVYHQQCLGVLVLQTEKLGELSEEDIPIFAAIGSQISSIAAYSGLLQALDKEKAEIQKLKDQTENALHYSDGAEQRRSLLRGQSVLSGYARGKAHILASGIGFESVEPIQNCHPNVELARFENALQTTVLQTSQLIEEMADLSQEDRSILTIHKQLAEDTTFRRKVAERISMGDRAEYALKQVVMEYVHIFSNVDDPYLQDRGQDIVDVGENVLRNLLGISPHGTQALTQDTIVIASDLSATELVALRQMHLKGIVLARGGKTSHTVILAKSFELPIVIQVEDIFDAVREGEDLILDGWSGLIFREPNKEIEREYNRLLQEHQVQAEHLRSLIPLPAVTRDTSRIELGANIGLLSDLEIVHRYRADHIGLYRTEFPFVIRKRLPTEEEQTELYTRMLKQARGLPVCFRTLDVGGDKFLSALDYPAEDNPFLGWRSIRVSLELEEMFRQQIRAVLRAAEHGPAQLMFPMIVSMHELEVALSIVEEERRRIGADCELPVGIMLEVPGTAKILPSLLPLIDFVSIGTNDLIQYTLAVDRNNPKVASLYTPFHPAVLSIIADAAEMCRKAQTSLSVCGEAAADPACAYLFLGLGIRKLSMNPSSIPRAKAMIRNADTSEAARAADFALGLNDSEAIRSWAQEQVGT